MPWRSLSRRRSDIKLAARRQPLWRRAAASGHDAGAVLSAITGRWGIGENCHWSGSSTAGAAGQPTEATRPELPASFVKLRGGNPVDTSRTALSAVERQVLDPANSPFRPASDVRPTVPRTPALWWGAAVRAATHASISWAYVNLAKTLLEIVRGGDVIVAAEHLSVTQSTETARVQRPDSPLDCGLFVRSRSGARMTDNGQMFLGHARELVHTWEPARRDNRSCSMDEALATLRAIVTDNGDGSQR